MRKQTFHFYSLNIINYSVVILHQRFRISTMCIETAYFGLISHDHCLKFSFFGFDIYY